MALIEYLDKVALEDDPEVAAVNKVTDDDMNEIKNVVNENFTNEITIGDIEPTSESCKIWIDTDEIDGASSEIEVGSNEPTNPGCKLWIDPAEVKNAGSELHVGKNAPDNNYQRVWFAMGKNLFNNKIENGRWSIIVGDVIRPVTNAGLRSTSAIEIQPNTTYTISATFYDGACFIIETDKDYRELAIDEGAPYKRFNFTIGERSSMTFTSHENAKYLYWYAPNTTIMPTEFQVELGSNMTNYESYITPSIQVDKNEIYSKEKTVHVGTSIDSNYKTNILYSANLFDESTYTNGMAWNNATGYPSRATAYFNIIAGKTYSISASNISRLNGGNVTIFEKSQSSASTSISSVVSFNTDGSFTFTASSGATVLAIQLLIPSGNISSSNYPDIMIVEGSTRKPYAKYVSQPSINVDGEDIYSMPVVLYNNSTGSNANITLSDNASNYNMISIDYFVNSSARVERKFIPYPQNKTCYLSMITPDPAGRIYINARSVTIQGTAINTTDSTRYTNTFINGSAITQSNSNEIYITKVLGYK